MDTGLRRYDGVCGDIQQKNRPVGGEFRFLRQSPKALATGDETGFILATTYSSVA